MRITLKSRKTLLSLLLVAAILVSVIASTLVVRAEDTTELAQTGADNYYFWGQNSNSPDFGSMHSPTGSFSYDGTKGYYYYDLTGASGDYCFVVSKVNDSGTSAVKSPAVGGVQNAGKYYLSQGNYHGYVCMHLWNPSGDAVRIYFSSESAGMNCIAQSEAGNTPNPTTAPQNPTTNSQNPTSAPSSNGYIYCKNTAGWGTVYAYLWSTGASDQNAEWPGAKMTKVSGNIWQYNIPKDFKNIIFSENGNNQTSDLTFPGSGYIYNNKTGQWSIYDTSPLQVQSFGTDLEAPQYAGVGITLTASATGQGTVYYKFSAGSTVLKDYSTSNMAVWTPSSAGTYTLTYEFKDSQGNTNKRTKTYQITDGTTASNPFIKTVSPANGKQIKKSSVCNISVTAGGGNTGTKLLFYKYTVKDASGNIVNVPYYTRNTSYSFTPTALGKYVVTVSVQGSDNAIDERDYIYDSVTNPSNPTDETAPNTPTTVSPTNSGGSSKIGDADMDGQVTILDATRIQRVLADLETQIDRTAADADYDGKVTIIDATRIQRFIAGLITKL